MRYRLTLSYRGRRYAGWQRQPNAVGVQQVVEEALSTLVGEPVTVLGASRTDAGVHALGQVVHLTLGAAWDASAFVGGANHHLPDDVRVMGAAPVAEDFHARRDAVAKEYRYRMSRAAVLSALDAPFVVRAPADISVELMSAAASQIEGRHDFSAFAKTGGAHTHPFRTMYQAGVSERGEQLEFRIVGDGFLRGMVRALVGTLLEVGTQKRSAANFRRLLEGRPRSEAGANAKAHGLTLMQVFYEEPGTG